jgi:5-formyltetrahydrofolate cyclo-ligase
MKNNLRKNLIKKRKKLSSSKIFKNSNQIKKTLFDLNDFKNASVILFYISYNNEVYTHEMIKDALSLGKKVIVPKSNTQNQTLILSKLTSWDDLELGSYGILEPKKEKIKKTSFEEIEIIIVPGVGFDKKGNRIGHGKGYYDKLLKKSKNAFHIGLAFEYQIIDKIPVDSHDIPVDMIITEDRIIGFI